MLVKNLNSGDKIGSTFDIENGLIGSPEITCNPSTIELAFKTKRVFKGKVFVKGHYSNPNCRVDYDRVSLDGKHPVGGIRLSHGQCDMNRQRTIQPGGMQFSTVLVISFHPLFITKLDRAFHIKCLYRETIKAVTSQLEVSTMATQLLDYDYPLPNCMYTIRKDEIDGPILKYARVGDQIVHRWECQSDIYGLLVHNCHVEDGQGEKQVVIDGNGCHTDRTLLGDPTYVESLNLAYRESLVFKFADRVVVRFQCQIRLCIKDAGGCAGVTPPLCSAAEEENEELLYTRRNEPFLHYSMDFDNITEPKRRRLIRSAASNNPKIVVDADLISQSLYVLDADDGDTSGQNAEKLDQKISDVCVGNTIFVVLICLLIFSLSALISSSVWVLYRWLRYTLDIL
ncbi:unnamed protein product [Thelazia callipaeda]|uniref:ZP domain-containing protein n=1 Tax=Thelazia callipaeda TaxID=103827 RepID=A0A0N5DAA1_THECL|nr:unnamed protein product [Thelazia callipaeda]